MGIFIKPPPDDPNFSRLREALRLVEEEGMNIHEAISRTGRGADLDPTRTKEEKDTNE